jgi:hypothetical protein
MGPSLRDSAGIWGPSLHGTHLEMGVCLAVSCVLAEGPLTPDPSPSRGEGSDDGGSLFCRIGDFFAIGKSWFRVDEGMAWLAIWNTRSISSEGSVRHLRRDGNSNALLFWDGRRGIICQRSGQYCAAGSQRTAHPPQVQRRWITAADRPPAGGFTTDRLKAQRDFDQSLRMSSLTLACHPRE